MQIHINDKDHLAEIWLTNCEAADASLRDRLTPVFNKWKQRKYLPVVYVSGTENLEENLHALMRHNADTLAEWSAAEPNSA